ncbi:hypothetical protein BDR05DRAFT_959900 [Suillus weaverae]|nr:hypothetical protein BDR05DRAFT_959900 [Suillus weaverae]
MRVFTLTTPVRSTGDPTYTNFVDAEGKTAQLIGHINNINNAVDFLFPPHVLDDPTACLQRAFLSPRNIFVDEFNDIIEGSKAGTSRRT